MHTLDRFEKFAFFVIAAIVTFCFCEAYISWPDAPVPRPSVHVEPIVPIIAPVEPRVEPLPVVAATARAKVAATRHRRHSDLAEALAYAKAYRNAKRANALLGEQRYREHA